MNGLIRSEEAYMNLSKETVLIANLYHSDYTLVESLLDDYYHKGFTVYKNERKAIGNGIEIRFLNIKDNRHRQEMRGYYFNDIVGSYDSEDLSRISR